MENQEVELTEEELQAKKQEIRDNVNKPSQENEDVKLPSEENEPKVYAGVYESLDELKKGITNLKSDVPEYMLNGMNEEALEQYYTDLRKEFSSKPKEEEKKEEETPKEDKPSDKISDDLWSELDREFNEAGDITEESRKKLRKAGIPDEVTEKYLNGLKAEAEVFTNKVFDLAGGQEQFETIKEWAEENYTQKELDLISSGSREDILFKMKAVKADYDKAVSNGDTNRLVGSNSNSTRGYNSQEEYIRDVASREYKTNPKYRAKVDEKFRASTFGQ